jgi:hypothetical protein
MEPTSRSDQYVAWLGAAVAAVVSIGTLLRRWHKDSGHQYASGEGVYVTGTKQAFDVLQQQITELRAEVHELRTRAHAFRIQELEYVGKIKTLEAQNWEQGQEMLELKAQNKEYADEITQLKDRLSLLERKTG